MTLSRLADPADFAPDLVEGWRSLATMVDESGLEPAVIRLVAIRVSQLNGCANDLNRHTAEAARTGETAQRLHLLAAWRDAPVYSPRERAALNWAEHLTLIAGG